MSPSDALVGGKLRTVATRVTKLKESKPCVLCGRATKRAVVGRKIRYIACANAEACTKRMAAR